MRASAEERAASFYRSGPVPVPPKAMSAEAKAIWRKIVATKPVDWFDAGSLPLLRLYCETLASAERIAADLVEIKTSSPGYSRALIHWRTQCSNAATLAKQLRLGVQHAVERQAAKAAEKAAEGQGDALIGGQAAERFKVVA